MPAVDLIAVACLAAIVTWGIRAGFSGTLPLAGFAAGAVAGALVAPLALRDGHESPFALALALPAALVAGGVVAAVVERGMPRRRRRRRARVAPGRTLDAIGGGLLGGWVALVTVWLLGAAAAQVTSMRERIKDSEIVGRLASVVELPGPGAPKPDLPIDRFPIVAGELPPIDPADPRVVREPAVLRADRSVVRIGVIGCEGPGLGSGWVAANGIVVTNAHVVEAARLITVRIGGAGPPHRATAIWFDPRNDFALLRVPGLASVRPLALVRRPRAGTAGAVIGFPLGRHAIRPARIGRTTATIGGRIGNVRPGSPLRRSVSGRLMTPIRARTQSGNSGGPVVDTSGRVLTTVWGGRVDRDSSAGVPNRFVSSALRRAGPAVGVGKCSGPPSDRLG